MLKPIFSPSQFLAYKRKELGLLEKGSLGGGLGGKEEEPLVGNTQRQISLGGNQFLGLKKKKEI